MNFVKVPKCSFCKQFTVSNTPHVCNTNVIPQPIPASTSCNSGMSKNIANDKKPEESVAKEDLAKLIDIMENCTPLWNHKISLSERSEAIKTNMWNRIHVEFNGKYSVIALKKSWKYLKEKYTREKKPAASGSAAPIKKEWPHLKSLKFLDNVIMVQKRTFDSLSSATDDNTDDLDESPKPKKKSQTGDHIAALLDVLKDMKPVPPALPEPIQPDEDYSFCNYLANIMKDIPRTQKLKLQAKIIGMVLENLQ